MNNKTIQRCSNAAALFLVVVVIFSDGWIPLISGFQIRNQRKYSDSSINKRFPGRFQLEFDASNRGKNNHLSSSIHRQTRNTLEPSARESSKHKNLAELKRRRLSPQSWNHAFSKGQNINHALQRSQSDTKLHMQFQDNNQRYNSVTDSSTQIQDDNPVVTTILKTPDQPLSKDYSNYQEQVKFIKTRYHQSDGTTSSDNPKEDDEELERIRLAHDNFMLMRNQWKCHSPVPEVVCVKDLYPTDSKDYLPRCAVLHRCGDKAGCCESDSLHCHPKAIQEIALYFYTIPSAERTSEGIGASHIESLMFENHTECECSASNDHSTSTTSTTVESEQKAKKDHGNQSAMHNGTCRDCPTPFYIRQYPNGHCSCDCFDKQKPCLKIKRGREPLDEREKRCVDTGRCQNPHCEFGNYNHTHGRCPKRPDDYRITSKTEHLSHTNARWNLLERD